MNILFITENEISPLFGGTERITHTLSQEFIHVCGYRCYSMFLIPAKVIDLTTFTGKHLLAKDDVYGQLDSFIAQYQIDAVICNLVRYASKRLISPSLYAVTRKYDCKVFNCYHAMPGEDLIGNSIPNIIYRIRKGDSIANNMKDFLLTVTPAALKKYVFGSRMKKKYRFFHDYCDRLVLLSDKFYEPYSRLAHIAVDEKFTFVNNSLSFAQNIDPSALSQKQKEVLILARLDDKAKRLSLALQIWKLIEQNQTSEPWKLNIVGGGIDADYLKGLIKRYGLKRASLEGRRSDAEVLEYYKRASIFMMTSSYEGWGITLMEAQQMGVVPMAFHSYAPVVDIIDDGLSGYVIDDKDVDAYAARLLSLMCDKQKREQMALQGLKSCRRYSQANVTQQWVSLFKEVGKAHA